MQSVIPHHFYSEIPSFLHLFLLDVGGVFLISSIAIILSSNSVSGINPGVSTSDFHLKIALQITQKITEIANKFVFYVFVDVSNTVDNCSSIHLT